MVPNPVRRLLALALALIAASLVSCASLGGSDHEGSGSAGSSVLSAVVDRGTLRVGMSGDQPPFNVVSKNGELIGLEVDLANALANSIGVDLEIVQRPFGTLLGALEAGEVDMVMSGLTMTPERNLKVAFVGPYFVSGKAILTKNENLAGSNEADDINKGTVRLAALAGSTSERFVQEVTPEAQLTAVQSYDEAVQAVIDGRVDALVADFPICVISVFRNPDAGLISLSSPFNFEPIGIAMPANDPLFTNLVTNYVNLLEGTGLLEELRSRWFVDAAWLDQLP
jgi:polar amino acid transport system substrate-binding protein